MDEHWFQIGHSPGVGMAFRCLHCDEVEYTPEFCLPLHCITDACKARRHEAAKVRLARMKSRKDNAPQSK